MKNYVLLLALLVSVAGVSQTVAPPPPGQECTDNLIFRKWNDLLFVNNGGGQFVSYQWYRDGQPVPGATAQYFHTEGVVMQGDGHLYHATATTSSGRVYVCCAYVFEDFLASQPLNPATGAQRAILYSTTGRKMGEWTTRPEYLEVSPGYYVWHITNENGESYTEKVIIQ